MHKIECTEHFVKVYFGTKEKKKQFSGDSDHESFNFAVDRLTSLGNKNAKILGDQL